jgi:osmotically-inducible protein OsmY
MNVIKSVIKSSILGAAIAMSLATMPVLAAVADDAKATDRTAGQVLDDATITASVKTALLEDERTKGFDINVDTAKGHVTLKGGADSWAAKTAATEIARKASGVVAVDNQLVIAATGSDARQEANRATASGEVRNALDETGDVVDDGWINSKVKTQLLASSEVSGLAINVDTKDNVVWLKGTVPTNTARATAIQIATSTKGVKSVNADQLVVAVN